MPKNSIVAWALAALFLVLAAGTFFQKGSELSKTRADLSQRQATIVELNQKISALNKTQASLNTEAANLKDEVTSLQTATTDCKAAAYHFRTGLLDLANGIDASYELRTGQATYTTCLSEAASSGVL